MEKKMVSAIMLTLLLTSMLALLFAAIPKATAVELSASGEEGEGELGGQIVEPLGPEASTVVMFETSHDQFTSDFPGWISDLQTAGYVVTTDDGDLNKIGKADILIIPGARGNYHIIGAYTDAEAKIIASYVNSGGNLILLSDWGPDYTVDTIEIAEELGVTLNKVGEGWTTFTTSNFDTSHPIMSGISNIEFFAHTTIASGGNSLIWTNLGEDVAVTLTYGQGCAVIFTDYNWPAKFENGYNTYDNAKLAMQTVGWLEICAPPERIWGIPVDFRFERDLSVKGKGGWYDHPDVRCLQIILNIDPDTRVATSGPGMPGNETTYFGDLTENAVKKFQKKYGLPETGNVDELTRGKLNEILNDKFTEEYKNSFNLLNTTERKSAIWNDIKSFKSSYPDLSSFPNELVLAVAAVETGEYAHWNNEHVADDWGRGIMQITSDSYVGAGGVDSGSEDCIKCRDRVLKIYCSKYYSNTLKGIEANIKDGLYALNDKYQRVKKDKIQPPEGYTKNETIWMSTVARYGPKGFTGYAYKYIWDVGDALIKLADGHYGSFDGFNATLARYLGQKFQKAETESIRLYSPGELRVYDTTGNITGLVNGEIREEIPNSIYDNETETVIVFFPSQNYYEVAGTETWTYGLYICFTKDSEATTFTAIDIPTSVNAIHQYTVDWVILSQGGDGVTVQVDSNGDGAFEYTFASDSELTQTEFLSQIAPPLSVSISPLSSSILVGQSVTFTSTVSGGYTPYTYQWYLNGNPVSGATSTTWTFTTTASGIYYVHLKVTDSEGNTTQSETARIAVAPPVPVGGYSIPIQTQTKAEPVLPYIALMATLTAIFTKLRPKTKRKR